MSTQIYFDKENKIYVTETDKGDIELSLEANNCPLTIRAPDLPTMKAALVKLSLVQDAF